MNINITEQKENVFFGRKEIKGTIIYEGPTPKNTDTAQELAKKISVPVENIVMKHIYSAFGATEAKFEAYAYKTKEQLDKIEPKKKEKKSA